AARAVLQEAARRIRAEIEAAGFDVVRSGAPSTDGSAFAAIVLADGSGGPTADVSLFLQSDGALSAALRIDARGLERSAAASGLAIRVVERLRASIAEIAGEERVERTIAPDVAAWAGVKGTKAPPKVTPQPVQGFVASPVASSAIEPPPIDVRPPDLRLPLSPPTERVAPQPATWIGAGVFGLFSIRGFAPSLGPLVHVRRDLPEQFSIGGIAAAPFGLTELEASSGTAVVRQGLALVTADRSFGPPDLVVSPRVTAGIGAHLTIADGDTSGEELRSHTATAAAFAAALNGGVGIRLIEGVRMHADFWTVLVLPEPVVVIDAKDAARGGFPMFGATTGIEVAP
ncbi:MAG: hypothetical protein HOV80_27690, partial [Polyangiaceae bacterium]|nr:hypothetical protein [Polyangiaceae bacterium]